MTTIVALMVILTVGCRTDDPVRGQANPEEPVPCLNANDCADGFFCDLEEEICRPNCLDEVPCPLGQIWSCEGCIPGCEEGTSAGCCDNTAPEESPSAEDAGVVEEVDTDTADDAEDDDASAEDETDADLPDEEVPEADDPILPSCDEGEFVCVDGTSCQLLGADDNCSSDEDCPVSYLCQERICQHTIADIEAPEPDASPDAQPDTRCVCGTDNCPLDDCRSCVEANRDCGGARCNKCEGGICRPKNGGPPNCP